MAIKISGVTVIDDTKNITNVANVALSGTLSVGATPSTGTSGQVLTSNGSAAYWSNNFVTSAVYVYGTILGRG